MNRLKYIIEKIIFNFKWVLIVVYFNLFWFLLKLIFNFVMFQHLSNQNIIDSLEAIDVTMVANLIIMIISGSYSSFINKKHSEPTEKVSSGALKVKIVTSIIGVTTIHLLQTFIAAESIQWDVIHKQVFIHAIFLVGALILAIIDYLHCKAESFHEPEPIKPQENDLEKSLH